MKIGLLTAAAPELVPREVSDKDSDQNSISRPSDLETAKVLFFGVAYAYAFALRVIRKGIVQLTLA
jgi:hypothetical protein